MSSTPYRGEKAPVAGELPWRGPGPDRPELPLPPGPMPLRRDGQNRKRWRYVGAFGEELMLCCARAEVGPLTQTFWILWDRERRRHGARTSQRPGGPEVRFDGAAVEIDSPGLRASLRLGECSPVESICPSPSGRGRGWGWTRKRAGVSVEGTVEIPGRRWRLAAPGVDDESAGYHGRHTSWRWSAGAGRAADGRDLAWNLVAGVNDPPERSERAIWVGGEPAEPPPVRFLGNTGIEIPRRAPDTPGAREVRGERPPATDLLAFHSESAHARDEDFLLLRSRYRHRFGSFSGSLGGIELADGLGVMEEHDALW